MHPCRPHSLNKAQFAKEVQSMMQYVFSRAESLILEAAAADHLSTLTACLAYEIVHTS